MLEYMANYDFENEYQLFAVQYQQTIQFELALLKSVMVEGYNTYVSGDSYDRETYICDDYTLKTKIRYREPTTINVVNENTNNLVFHTFYARIRNIEEGNPFKKPDMNRIVSKAKYFYKALSPQQSLSYVKEQFRSLYKFKPGTTYYHTKRSAIKKDLREAEETAEERVETLRSPDSMIVSLPDPIMGSY